MVANNQVREHRAGQGLQSLRSGPTTDQSHPSLPLNFISHPQAPDIRGWSRPCDAARCSLPHTGQPHHLGWDGRSEERGAAAGADRQVLCHPILQVFACIAIKMSSRLLAPRAVIMALLLLLFSCSSIYKTMYISSARLTTGCHRQRRTDSHLPSMPLTSSGWSRR